MQNESYREVVEVDLEGGDELEAALRREGYRLTRRELDELMEQREYELFKARVARYAAEVGAEPALTPAEDDDEDGEKPKKRALPKSTKKPTKNASTSEPVDEEEAEWV